MTNTSNTPISRRTIMAGAGLAGVAAVTPVSASLLPDPDKSEEYDVVVIGSGMAGCAAALEAAEARASVVIIDETFFKPNGRKLAFGRGRFLASGAEYQRLEGRIPRGSRDIQSWARQQHDFPFDG